MASRRIFLRAGGLALLSFGAAPRALMRAVAASGGTRNRLLVVLLQRGACDGLNTVVPYGEEEYRSLRPTIAIPPPGAGRRETAFDLDGHFGLHPALEPLMPLWKERSLAVVQAVGSPHPSRSHFDAQDFLETGRPGRKGTPDGWLNRHLQASGGETSTPFRAVSMSPTLPRILGGPVPVVAVPNLREFRLRGPGSQAAAQGFERMYAAGANDSLHDATTETFEAVKFLEKVNLAAYRPGHGARYPRGSPGDALRQLAQLVKADAGVEVAFVQMNGWDHHFAEGGVTGQLALRLRELGEALAAFHADLGDRMADIVVVTLTEFGRTARENGNRGTDHGHGSVALVLGGPIAGGRVYGKWPGLRSDQLYEGRDLAITTDFRVLVGEVLTRHMGARDLRPVFPDIGISPSHFPGVIRG